MMGILCYFAFSATRDIAGVLAFYYFTNTKRVAKIFSCLTISSEIIMLVPGLLALDLSIIMLQIDDTCRDKQIYEHWLALSIIFFFISHQYDR